MAIVKHWVHSIYDDRGIVLVATSYPSKRRTAFLAFSCLVRQLSSTGSGSRPRSRDRDDILGESWAWKSLKQLVSEERKTLAHCATFSLNSSALHSYRANTHDAKPKSFEVSKYLPQPFWPPSVSFPSPTFIDRSGGIFAAAAPTPRCQP